MTRYVYVVISGESDNYAAMCLISAISVRAVDPGAKITVLSDAATQAMLSGRKDPLLDVADEIVVCPAQVSPAYTSRVLKTTMLQRLESDFIFLDVDTVVVRPIAPRLAEPHSLQIALDQVETIPKTGFPAHLGPLFQSLDWDSPTPQYYNSGVLFVRADETSKRLFEEWHRRWRLSSALGQHQDQPALNSSIMATGTPICCLPVQCNAMVRVDETFRRRAQVLHFLAEGHKLEMDAEYPRLVVAARSGRKITPEQIRAAVFRRWPLVHPGSVRRQLQVGNIHVAWKLYRERKKAGNSLQVPM